jgi:hypothetical protein
VVDRGLIMHCLAWVESKNHYILKKVIISIFNSFEWAVSAAWQSIKEENIK